MKKNNALFVLYVTGTMLLLLYSLHAYFLWWMYDGIINQFIAEVIVFGLGVTYLFKKRISLHVNNRVLMPFFIVWIVAAWNPVGISTIVYNCPLAFLSILLLDKDSLRILLNVWTNLFAIILLVSLIAWPFALMGVLPSYGIINFGDKDAYYYINYLFCLVNLNIVNWDTIRFCSVFLEPGHIAMIGAFTLYLNHYNFRKWSSWVILLVSLFSFSLAGYLLVALSYILIKIQKDSIAKSIRSVFSTTILLSVVYLFAVAYKGGNNNVNNLIIERLEYDEEKVVVGNNRVFGDTDDFYTDFIVSKEALTGLSRIQFNRMLDDKTIGGAGYKMYLLEKGILGTLIIFICYVLLSRFSLDKRFIYFFLLLYVIAFIQRSWPASHIWLFLFVFGTAVNGRQFSSYSYKNQKSFDSLTYHYK